MRAWDSRGTVHSMPSFVDPNATASVGDPEFARASVLQAMERTVMSDFGDDPVVFARNNGSLPQGGLDSDEVRDDGVGEKGAVMQVEGQDAPLTEVRDQGVGVEHP